MQYILLIHNKAEAAARPELEANKIFGEYMEFSEAIGKSGHMLAGEPLEATSTHYARALTGNQAEQRYLKRRLAELKAQAEP